MSDAALVDTSDDPPRDREFAPVQGGFHPHSRTIAVVGGGVSGLAAVIGIVKARASGRSALNIQWINETEDYGPGTVYRDYEGMLDANVPVKQMSIFNDDPGHFRKWLAWNYPRDNYTENSFVPRSVYADYLRSCAAAVTNEAADHGITVTQQYGKVVDVVRNGEFKAYFGKADANTGSGLSCVIANQVVLALGHMPGEDPFCGQLDNHGKYFRTINSQNYTTVLNAIPTGYSSRDKDVLIVGFGSSAVDRLRLLDHVGYLGKITIITRHETKPWSYIPERDGQEERYQLGLQADSVRQLAEQYKDATDSQARATIVERFVGLIDGEVTRSLNNGSGPQNFLYSPKFLEILENSELASISPAFVESVNKVISFFRANPTPPRDAALIEHYEASGRLKVLYGNAESAKILDQTGDKKISITYRETSGEEKPTEADVVFDGSPYARNSRNNSLLSTILLSRGMGKFSRRFDGMVECRANGEFPNMPGLFAIGPFAIRNGINHVVWGVETFRKWGMEVGKSIVENMDHDFRAASAGISGGNVGYYSRERARHNQSQPGVGLLSPPGRVHRKHSPRSQALVVQRL